MDRQNNSSMNVLELDADIEINNGSGRFESVRGNHSDDREFFRSDASQNSNFDKLMGRMDDILRWMKEMDARWEAKVENTTVSKVDKEKLVLEEKVKDNKENILDNSVQEENVEAEDIESVEPEEGESVESDEEEGVEAEDGDNVEAEEGESLEAKEEEGAEAEDIEGVEPEEGESVESDEEEGDISSMLNMLMVQLKEWEERLKDPYWGKSEKKVIETEGHETSSDNNFEEEADEGQGVIVTTEKCQEKEEEGEGGEEEGGEAGVEYIGGTEAVVVEESAIVEKGLKTRSAENNCEKQDEDEKKKKPEQNDVYGRDDGTEGTRKRQELAFWRQSIDHRRDSLNYTLKEAWKDEQKFICHELRKPKTNLKVLRRLRVYKNEERVRQSCLMYCERKWWINMKLLNPQLWLDRSEDANDDPGGGKVINGRSPLSLQLCCITLNVTSNHASAQD